MNNYALYPHEKPDTLHTLLEFCASTYLDGTAFAWSLRKNEHKVSYREFRDQVHAVAAWLLNDSSECKHIALLGENSYEWILVHFAVTCSRNVIVPIDKELSAPEAEELIEQSGCRTVFCSEAYRDIPEQMNTNGLRVIGMSELSQIIQKGEELLAGERIHLSECLPSKNDLASIVYTSGTTGKSKGVMLTHGNFMSDMYGSACNVLLEGDGLLVLPLHHTFGLVAGVFASMFYGHTVCINRSLKNLAQDMQKYKPQNMFIVPAFAEQFYRKIMDSAKEKKKDKVLCLLASVSSHLLKTGIDIRRRVFRSVHEAFGGELSLLVSGGAPIDEHLIRSLSAFGFTVLNGYGITECGPVVAVNRNRFIVPGSVGLPLVCNEVRIDDDGEILVKGENVMVGYYHMEEETKAAMTRDGWFRTGDLGDIDSDGVLHITGRKKNLIILNNGENIPAEPLEMMLMQSPFIAEAVVFAKDDAITAEVYLNPETPDASSRIHDEIRKVNRGLQQNKNIANVIIRNEPFPKTTTRKIKRDRRS